MLPRLPRPSRGLPFRLAALALVATVGLLAGSPAGAEESRTPTARQVKPLRLGFVAAARPNDAIDRMEPFRLRLADTLGNDVQIRRFADERSLIDAFAAGKIDYAPLSASGYAMVSRLCGCAEPLAAPRASDGSAGWRITVVVPTGSPVEKLAGLDGRRLGLSGAESIGGHRLALRMIEQQEAKSPPKPRLETFSGPRAALKAMLEGRVDAAVVWSTLEGDVAEGYGRGTLRDMVAAGEVAMTDVRVIWASTVLPHGPHAIRSDFAEGPKRRLRDMLVDLDEVDPDAYDAVEPVLTGGFLRIGHAAYLPFVDLVTPRPRSSEPDTTGSTAPPG